MNIFLADFNYLKPLCGTAVQTVTAMGLGGRGSMLLQPFALVPASVAQMPASAAPAPFGVRSAVLLKLEADTVLLLLALLPCCLFSQ